MSLYVYEIHCATLSGVAFGWLGCLYVTLLCAFLGNDLQYVVNNLDAYVYKVAIGNSSPDNSSIWLA